ncbi:MAG TPA: bZIP transcription factor [Parafilimonas sp.]|nr:bZIP transcription factor [Parafilimonas sp.]
MKTNLAFIAAVITVSAAISVQQANAQNIFPDSGRVGIGTRTPTAQLDVNSTATGQIARFNGGSSSMYVSLLEGGVYRGYIGSYAGNNEDVDFGTGSSTSGKLHLTIKAVPKLTIDNTGRVGIGTVSPVARMEIYHNSSVSNPQLLLYESANDYARLSFQNTATTSYFSIAGLPATATAASKLNFYYSAFGDIMTVQGNGHVGILTTNPQYQLSVNGTIQAKEVRVESGWADYVFDKEYKLTSLEELEQYITTNKHLPGVAPAAEVQKDGMKVGEMNKAMMEKIEELTLYVIQLGKENKQLKSEIEALKK